MIERDVECVVKDPELDQTAGVTLDEGASTSASKRELVERGACIGRYVVLSPLGEGGMGVVYKAYDPELDRPIALKLLHAEVTTSKAAGRERLLREAQALARLSHPNVVGVHDVGTHGDNVFIAMEFVAGQNLRQWLAQAPRSRDEIVAAFFAAGTGLQAAHQAGLVHRDFKPENVMVGDDGRVRVLDFGLVRSADASGVGENLEQSLERAIAYEEPPPEDGHGDGSGHRSSSGQVRASGESLDSAGLSSGSMASGTKLATPLTLAGAIMGTPHYMAPEQHAGRAIDARADQFSFCVALYHALYNAWPFPGATPAQLKRRVLAGKIADPPAGTRVPNFLRKALLRGLEVDPRARHASMQELLFALRADPQSARKKWLARALALAVVVMLGGTFEVLRGRGARLCAAADEKLQGAWSEPRREAIRRAFRATRAPYAGAALASVEGLFDQYAHAWSGMRVEACEATHVRGEQSAELLDLRMACLDDRLTQLKTLSDLYASDANTLVSRAAETAQSLPSLAACADASALKAPIRPPDDRATQKRVEQVRDELSRAKALGLAARYDDGLRIARAALSSARKLAYAPVEAEASLVVGMLLDGRGEYEAESSALQHAYVAALGGRHDEAATRAAIELLLAEGSRRGRYDEGDRWAEIAEAMVGRLGNRPDLLGMLRLNRAMLREREGKYEEALRDVTGALTLAERVQGKDHASAGNIYHQLGNIYYHQAKYPQALEAYQHGFAIAQRTLGAEHPKVIANLVGMADVYGESGDRERPLPMYQEALAAIERVQSDHPYIPIICNNMAEELLLLERPRDALGLFQRAYDMWQKELGPSLETTSALLGLGQSHLHLGELEPAVRDLENANEVCTSALGAEHEYCGTAGAALGEAYERLGKGGEALSAYQRGVGVIEKALGASHPDLIGPLLGIGRLELLQGAAKRARPALARALALCEARPEAQCKLDEVRFALGQALWSTGLHAEARRMIEQVQEAQMLAQATPTPGTSSVADWLHDHPH